MKSELCICMRLQLHKKSWGSVLEHMTLSSAWWENVNLWCFFTIFAFEQLSFDLHSALISFRFLNTLSSGDIILLNTGSVILDNHICTIVNIIFFCLTKFKEIIIDREVFRHLLPTQSYQNFGEFWRLFSRSQILKY